MNNLFNPYDLFEMRLRLNEVEAEYRLEHDEEQAHEIDPRTFDRTAWMACYDSLG